MTDDGWEARMAARARERREAWDPDLIPRTDRDIEWDAQIREMNRVRAEARARLLGEYTLGMAVERTNWLRAGEMPGCACPGPPVCCWEWSERAERMQAFATYAARLMVARMESGC